MLHSSHKNESVLHHQQNSSKWKLSHSFVNLFFHILPFCYSVSVPTAVATAILSFHHAAVLPYCHSANLPYCCTPILPFAIVAYCYTAIQPLCHTPTRNHLSYEHFQEHFSVMNIFVTVFLQLWAFSRIVSISQSYQGSVGESGQGRMCHFQVADKQIWGITHACFSQLCFYKSAF